MIRFPKAEIWLVPTVLCHSFALKANYLRAFNDLNAMCNTITCNGNGDTAEMELDAELQSNALAGYFVYSKLVCLIRSTSPAVSSCGSQRQGILQSAL
jgi:hypothetical protein